MLRDARFPLPGPYHPSTFWTLGVAYPQSSHTLAVHNRVMLTKGAQRRACPCPAPTGAQAIGHGAGRNA